MKYIFLFLILFSLPLMAMKTQGKHYILTEDETETKWRYYYRQDFSIGLKSKKILMEKCYNMHIETSEKVEIPCAELDKLKPSIDLREIGESERSASAV